MTTDVATTVALDVSSQVFPGEAAPPVEADGPTADTTAITADSTAVTADSF